MNPKVSIIIPLYNAEQYIVEAIDSCLNQTYKNIEVIVIDDGSTDDSKKKINHYIQGHKIKYVYQNNKERSAARNHGLNIASGEYINFLDSDDLLHCTKIEKQVDLLEKNRDFFAIYSAVEYFHYKTRKKIAILAKRCSRPEIINDLVLGNFIPIQSILVRKSNIRFDEGLKSFEDWYYFLNILIDKKVLFSNEVLSSVRVDNHQSREYQLGMRYSELLLFYQRILRDERFNARKARIMIVFIRKLILYVFFKIFFKVKSLCHM